MRPRQRWSWLRMDRLLGELRLPKDSAAARREVERHTEGRRGEAEEDPAWRKIRRGWFLGDRKLKRELMGETKADRLLADGLKKSGWGRGVLKRWPKGDSGEVELAVRLRSETTVTPASIAGRLEMGSGSGEPRLPGCVESVG